MKNSIKPVIEYTGQPYVDNAVFVRPKQRSVIELSVADAFKNRGSPNKAIKIGYERVRLQWMKLGPDGVLIPK